jgi:hypothetical protein
MVQQVIIDSFKRNINEQSSAAVSASASAAVHQKKQQYHGFDFVV